MLIFLLKRFTGIILLTFKLKNVSRQFHRYLAFNETNCKHILTVFEEKGYWIIQVEEWKIKYAEVKIILQPLFGSTQHMFSLSVVFSYSEIPITLFQSHSIHLCLVFLSMSEHLFIIVQHNTLCPTNSQQFQVLRRHWRFLPLTLFFTGTIKCLRIRRLYSWSCLADQLSLAPTWQVASKVVCHPTHPNCHRVRHCQH